MTSSLLLQNVRDAATQIDELLRNGTFARPQEGFPSPAELTVILGELRCVESQLLNSTVPPRGQRGLSIGRIISDTWWNYNREPLTELLMHIVYDYKRKL